MDNRKSAEPARVGDVVSALLKNLGVDKNSVQARVACSWEAIVGKEVAAHTRPAEIRRGVLLVHVDSSPWFNELNRNHRAQVIVRLRETIGENDIRDIKFKIGEI